MNEIDNAIKILVQKSTEVDANEAMKYTQAALNLAHAFALLEVPRKRAES